MKRIRPESPSPRFSRRRAFALMGGGTLGCLADAFWIEPGSLSVTRHDVIRPKLPSGLDGLKICLLSDFHFEPGKDNGLLEKTVEAVRREKPDLVALTGDYTDRSPAVIAPLLEGLGKLSASHGVFAVMGNHDKRCGGEMMRRQFEKAGISFLINQNSQLSIKGDKLAVAGTDFVWHGNPDPLRTLKGISKDTPVLALVHEPDYFDIMTVHRDLMLQVSGHTHGGQCRVPLLGIAPATVKWGRNYTYGEYARGDSRIFVTRGLGMTGIRVRFSCPPEMAVLTLRSSKSA